VHFQISLGKENNQKEPHKLPKRTILKSQYSARAEESSLWRAKDISDVHISLHPLSISRFELPLM
jgi:hypothetical protein